MGQPDNEAARDMYRIFVQSLETHYSEIIRFVAILIPSLTGYGVILYQYAISDVSTLAVPLLMITIVVIVMQVWGSWSALAMSYRFRYLKLALSKIERHFGVETLLPKTFRATSPIVSLRDRVFLEIAPEILRVHVFVFVLVVVLVSVGSSLMLREPMFNAFLAAAGALAIGCTMYWGAIRYPNKYNELLKDIEPEQGTADSDGGQTGQAERAMM